MPRFASFVDAGHLFKTLAHFNFRGIDFAHVASEMSYGQTDGSIYYYDCPATAIGLQSGRCRATSRQHLLAKLSQTPGVELRLGRLSTQTCRECGCAVHRQKQVDTQLAIDLVVLAVKGLITHASLFASDSDFIPAVKTAQEHGCAVHLFHGRDTHPNLIAVCDAVTAVTPEFFRRVA